MFEKHGAVSGECVKEMAENLHKLTNCELTIALSGIAGPTGGTPAKPVGTVWFGFYFKEQTIAIHKRFSGTRDLIRKLATEFALQQAIEILNNHK
jgi:PncC family amidohydrolase